MKKLWKISNVWVMFWAGIHSGGYAEGLVHGITYRNKSKISIMIGRKLGNAWIITNDNNRKVFFFYQQT